MDSSAFRKPAKFECRLVMALFAACLAFHFWGITVGWRSKNLPGNEFRQAQTAISSYWINADSDFSLAYPTPILGKPWSIPMEFPLYQWTTVVVSRVTHWSLTKAGRAVSIACFYLMLPAIFLLLRRWRVAPEHRWLVLALILTCPFYIFFTRAVLMETMALMFSLWFWVAFERAVEGRSKFWLIVAILAGSGAGLVKVTTYMLYLLPAGWWAFARLWAKRRGEWKTEFWWMAAASAVPFAATLWWLHFADATKALNPLAVFIESGNLTDFNFGTTATRFSPSMWLTKLHIVGEKLTSLPVMIFCGLLMLWPSRRRWSEVLVCLACFASVLVIFPVLYTLHDYYYTANTVMLLVAMGLAIVALAEAPVARWLVYVALGLVLAGQAWRYREYYYPGQSQISWGGDGLTRSLNALTRPRDVIVISGQDWNSMTPYYARRRAIMLRDDVVREPVRVEETLAGVKDEHIGALVITGHSDGEQWLIDRAAVRGISRQPLYVWRDTRVYVPVTRQTELRDALLDQHFDEVRLAPGVTIPKRDLSHRWMDYAALRPWEKQPFSGMEPKPVRFYSQFGPAMDGSSGQPMYGAHPVTRLVFMLPAGVHVLKGSLQMPLDAYRLDLPDADATDGVAVSLHALGPHGESQLLATRYFDPRHNREDRGNRRPLEFTFKLSVPGEIELSFTPGPANRLTRDWIQLGPLRIK